MEATGHHVAPHDWSASGREALEVASVGGTERSLPGNSVLALHENLDLDLGIREGTPIHAGDFEDRIVPPFHVLIRKVSDIVRCEELAQRIQVSVADERRVGGFDFLCERSVHTMVFGCDTTNVDCVQLLLVWRQVTHIQGQMSPKPSITHRNGHYFLASSRTTAVIARTPVRMVGSGSGRN